MTGALRAAETSRADTATGNRCKARRRDGSPCGAYAGAGSEFCFWHDPATVPARSEASSRGGRARHARRLAGAEGPRVALRSLADVLPLVERAVNDLLSLENSVARARAIGSLATVAIRAIELSDLAGRVAALERVLLERGRRDG